MIKKKTGISRRKTIGKLDASICDTPCHKFYESVAFLIRNLSLRLSEEFGKGYAETNLRYFRQFYMTFPAASTVEIRHALRDELTWTHYRLLMRVEKPEARAWYLNEAAEQCCDILDSKRVPVNGEDREKRIGEIPCYGANGLQGYIDDFIFDEPLILIAEDGGTFDEFATRPIAHLCTIA